MLVPGGVSQLEVSSELVSEFWVAEVGRLAGQNVFDQIFEEPVDFGEPDIMVLIHKLNRCRNQVDSLTFSFVA